jgi:8-oxo-dGTP pyrophosphatase MutT (NUDIX family)
MDMKEELSAGGVVCRRVSVSAGQRVSWQFLIGKHSGYSKWVLPKGLVEKGEGLVETAVREVEEEVGVMAKVVNLVPVKTIEYSYVAELGKQVGESANGQVSERRVKKYQEDGGEGVEVHKKVVFYLMELEEELPDHGWEMSERKWVSYEEAMKLLGFESEREVLVAASKLL